jgi:hypothetical protein
LKSQARDGCQRKGRAIKAKVKKTLVLLLRIAISLGLIAWILMNVDRTQLLESMRTIDPGFLLLAQAAYFVVNGICAWRWQVLLAGRGVAVGYPRLLRYFLNGLFFGNFLPTTVGGDLMRAYLVSDDCGTRSEALASVLVDRFIGLFGVIVTGVIGLILVARTGQEAALLRYMALGVGLTLALLAVFLNKGIMRRFRVLLRLPLVNRLEQKLVEFYHSLYVYRSQRREVALALALSLLVQLGVVLTVFVISRALGSDISITPFFLYMPVIAAVSMLPVSINGWGLMEGAFIVFFGRAGMSGTEALTLGFIYHLVAVAVSLSGGVLWLILGRGRRPKTECLIGTGGPGDA